MDRSINVLLAHFKGRRENSSSDSAGIGIDDVTQRRPVDAAVARRAVSSIGRPAQAGTPFFACVALQQAHLPTEPNAACTGRAGNGNGNRAACLPHRTPTSAGRPARPTRQASTITRSSS
jgi:hypothetical protein